MLSMSRVRPNLRGQCHDGLRSHRADRSQVWGLHDRDILDAESRKPRQLLAHRRLEAAGLRLARRAMPRERPGAHR